MEWQLYWGRRWLQLKSEPWGWCPWMVSALSWSESLAIVRPLSDPATCGASPNKGKGQSPGQGHALGWPSWGRRWLRGLEATQQRWWALSGPDPWGREGYGLMCHVPLSFTVTLPHARIRVRRWPRALDKARSCPQCAALGYDIIKWSPWAGRKLPTPRTEGVWRSERQGENLARPWLHGFPTISITSSWEQGAGLGVGAGHGDAAALGGVREPPNGSLRVWGTEIS